MKTPSKIIAASVLTALLGACSTLDFKAAEPEKYAGLDCEQLDALAESYRPTYESQLFADMDYNTLERDVQTNRTRQVGEIRNGATPYEESLEQDRRSIALARRQKGCK